MREAPAIHPRGRFLFLERPEKARYLLFSPPNSFLCRFGKPQSFRVMKTSLSLLTREGAIVVTFAAVLTPAQYAQFYDCVQEADSKPELKDCIGQFAEKHGLKVLMDDANALTTA